MNLRAPDTARSLRDRLVPAWKQLASERMGFVVAAAAAHLGRSVPRAATTVAIATVALWLVGMALPWWLPAALFAFALIGALLALALRDRRARTSLHSAALACDRANDNHDRLAAALELSLAAPQDAQSQYEQLARAAIDDGVQSLQRIDLQRIAAQPRPPLPWRRALLAYVALLALPLLLPVRADAHTPDASPSTVAARPADANAQRTATRDAADRAATTESPRARTDAPKPKSPDEKRGTPPPPPPSDPAPASPAQSGLSQSGSDTAGDGTQSGAPKQAPAGNVANGQSGGGQGASASGAPDPQQSEQQPPPKPPKQKPKPKSPDKPDPKQEAQPSSSAGAPSGPSRGNGRMKAIGNKRDDQNRGQEREDEPQVEDEPVEDETDEQEQRGGVMPMRRGDNRPPARELSISGDGPPDQGRGGPTPPKKARGTASLVLGMRLADSVRGQPNPGTAKTSLEQIPPRPSTADPGAATAATGTHPGTPQTRRAPHAFADLLQRYSALLRDGTPTTASPTDTPPRR